MSPIALIALAAPLFPAAAFLALGLVTLAYKAPGEKTIARMASVTFTLSVAATFVVAGWFLTHDDGPILIALGTWFHTDDYGFEASLLVDRLSVPMMVLTATLCGVIGRFSATYLVREPGQPRFYLLLCLFATGMFVLVMAGSLDLLVAGWELVGVSSFLLIGFFHERPFPVRNALRAFVIYRTCDIGLLAGTLFMHHYAGSGDFSQAFGLNHWPGSAASFDPHGATLVAICLLFAACGKSALFPASSWLPRAMEGPTPSSAIFYGALSVHAGAYLMLRIHPLLDSAPIARVVITAIGLLTALHGTLVARVQTDVKSQLAYATISQVGLIFVEIGLGFPRLAVFHIVGHAVVRTLQMLRAPNAIQDAMLLRAAVGRVGRMETGRHLAPIAPSHFGHWLYHLSLERFHLDGLWDRGLARPLLGLSHALDALETRWLAFLGRSFDPREPSEPQPQSVAPREGGGRV
jgi:NADH:ubiquinone oxidoreductase subunit 5 (subunit L)/multisubunit Na+/H+ antiporter MnhA subunit